MAKLPSIEVESSQHPHIANPFKKALATLVLLGAGINLAAAQPPQQGSSPKTEQQTSAPDTFKTPSGEYKLPQQRPPDSALKAGKPYFFEWKGRVMSCGYDNDGISNQVDCGFASMAVAQRVIASGQSSNRTDTQTVSK